MSAPPKIVDRLSHLVLQRNRELTSDAVLSAVLGLVFSLLTFGFLYWLGWFFGLFLGRSLNAPPWLCGAFLSGLFFLVATWSAWRRVDPLAGLRRLSDAELMLTLVSHATGELVYFSPRHALAGAAVVLIGGPGNLLAAIASLTHRLSTDAVLFEQAARMLKRCREPFPIEAIQEVEAAFLLKRLALIKVVPLEDSHAIVVTEKGSKTLGGAARDH